MYFWSGFLFLVKTFKMQVECAQRWPCLPSYSFKCVLNGLAMSERHHTQQPYFDFVLSTVWTCCIRFMVGIVQSSHCFRVALLSETLTTKCVLGQAKIGLKKKVRTGLLRLPPSYCHIWYLWRRTTKAIHCLQIMLPKQNWSKPAELPLLLCFLSAGFWAVLPSLLSPQAAYMAPFVSDACWLKRW